jgi:hypothetical protein
MNFLLSVRELKVLVFCVSVEEYYVLNILLTQVVEYKTS